MKNENMPEIPLCVNVIRLQQYRLDPDATILFDWLVIKTISFHYKEFHYSQARIEQETRIKRSRQESIIDDFQQMGFLSSEIREHAQTRGRVRFFAVDFKQLAKKTLLRRIIDEPSSLFDNFLEFAQYHAKIQANNRKKNTSEPVHDTSEIYHVLNKQYNARLQMYNEGEFTSRTPRRLKPATQIQRNKTISRKLNSLNKLYDVHTIRNAFIAYTDAVLKQEEDPQNFMYLFLTYDQEQGSFPVFESYLNKYNKEYSYSRK